jgi:hypothetical protein
MVRIQTGMCGFGQESRAKNNSFKLTIEGYAATLSLQATNCAHVLQCTSTCGIFIKGKAAREITHSDGQRRGFWNDIAVDRNVKIILPRVRQAGWTHLSIFTLPLLRFGD